MESDVQSLPIMSKTGAITRWDEIVTGRRGGFEPGFEPAPWSWPDCPSKGSRFVLKVERRIKNESGLFG